MRDITHFIDGASVAGTSGRYSDVFNPNTGEVQARLALASVAEVDAAVASALRAQQTWAMVNPQRRARVMFEFKRLVEARMDELAELLSSEHGKVVADSRGDIQRGLEVIEFACVRAPDDAVGRMSIEHASASPLEPITSLREERCLTIQW